MTTYLEITEVRNFFDSHFSALLPGILLALEEDSSPEKLLDRSITTVDDLRQLEDQIIVSILLNVIENGEKNAETLKTEAATALFAINSKKID